MIISLHYTLYELSIVNSISGPILRVNEVNHPFFAPGDGLKRASVDIAYSYVLYSQLKSVLMLQPSS